MSLDPTTANGRRVFSTESHEKISCQYEVLPSLTGHSTTLFRPPYNADSRPANIRELLPIGIAQSLGYMTILESVDPRDWQKPDKKQILQRVKGELPRGNILLLHDGGGDRSETVAALPAILHYLKERGNRVVLLSELLGLDEKMVMPVVTEEKKSIHNLASSLGLSREGANPCHR
ncbi:MAG: hypothetical protein WC076_09380 [Terrimicrobiaceae bacterium]